MSDNFIETNWKDSVYSDGSSLFVSNQRPQIGETVIIRLRLLAGSPIEHIYLRYIKDGSQILSEMKFSRTVHSLQYYETEIPITQNKLRYQFYLQSAEMVYCYTQRCLTDILQNETSDFCLLSDYVQPSWVKNSVFYQIFPERFCNGNPENDVTDGEISMDGFLSQKISDWNTDPLPYEKSHCLDFYGGDLEGITQKIPYLKELGVTAIYLNPIFLSPTVHKYDCIDYEHVDPHFGGDEALRILSEALHKNGMKLILDISINHTGTDHKWFNRDGTWFDQSVGAFHNPGSEERSYYIFGENNSYMGWLDHQNMPELNYRNEKLRDKLYRSEDSIIKKWLKPPYSIDGWRFDVADVMAKYGPDQLDHEVWKEIRKSIRSVDPEAYILAEEWTDCSEYLQGEEWDSPMNYYSCGRVWRPFAGLSDSYLDALGVLSGIRHRISAPEVKERIQGFLSLIPFALQQNLFNLIDSHDVPRTHNEAGIDPQEYKGIVIAQFTMIGAPSLYYGDEAGIQGWTFSVEGCRFPMPWDSGFESSEIYRFYHDLIHLRAEHTAFQEGTFQFLYAKDQILAFARETEEECFISVISTEKEDTRILLPAGILAADLSCVPAIISGKDALGTPLDIELCGNNMLSILVKAHESYVFQVK